MTDIISRIFRAIGPEEPHHGLTLYRGPLPVPANPTQRALVISGRSAWLADRPVPDYHMLAESAYMAEVHDCIEASRAWAEGARRFGL
jgi:hypothetical protein